MFLYMISSFFYSYIKENRYKNIIYIGQSLLIFSIQLMSFFNLCMETKNIKYLFLYLFVQIFLFTTIVMVPMIYEKINRLLLNHMCMMLGIGLCMIARLSIHKAIKQYIIVMISFMISLLIPYLLSVLRFWKKMTWLYGSLGIFMLAVVLIIGEVTYGSKIAFSIRGITFQPSEFVKILFVFFLAAALWENVSQKRVIITSVIACMYIFILVLSKDLGSALIFAVGFLLVLFVASGNYLYLMIGSVVGGMAAFLAYHLFDHVKVRVMAWYDPWKYIDNQGYQITQSLFAIGGGSWFGMGLYKGNPKAIPFVEADFIFSAICEEFGVIFGICLLLICMNCFIEMMRITIQIHDRFYQLIVYGFGIMYLFQIFLTVGGGIKFIPLTGVTLPFISYGGSSVMTTMIMFFIIQGIYIRLHKEGERAIARDTERYTDGTEENDNPGQETYQ